MQRILDDVNQVKLFPESALQLSENLIQWFRVSARDLPWRRERTPYRVWLSEIMLQQTRVATVIDYFHRFVTRFPDVHSLAAADLDDVLALWSGLGYYARGRNLHRAAQKVSRELGGEFPATVEGLLELPGVGPYTAGAIASLAFQQRAPIVDGNVSRVLARLCDDDTPIDSPLGRRVTSARAAALVQAAPQPALLNEGLMELGALVCTPRNPMCSECPWQRVCRSREHQNVSERPVKLPRRARKQMHFVAVVIRHQQSVWLERRQEGGLFGALFEPPVKELASPGEWTEAAGDLLRARGIAVPERLPTPIRVQRTLTHRELLFDVVAIDLPSSPATASHWFDTHRLREIGLSSAVRAVLEAAAPKQPALAF